MAPSLPRRATRRREPARCVPADPGPAAERAARAEATGRPATLCTACGAPTAELFTYHSTSGKTFCLPCADQAVAAYYRRHPEARTTAGRTPKERTGTAYLQERERYVVRYHAGNGRWQISDTQTHRWIARSAATETGAAAIAAAMNAAWRTQVDSETYRFAAGAVGAC